MCAPEKRRRRHCLLKRFNTLATFYRSGKQKSSSVHDQSGTKRGNRRYGGGKRHAHQQWASRHGGWIIRERTINFINDPLREAFVSFRKEFLRLLVVIDRVAHKRSFFLSAAPESIVPCRSFAKLSSSSRFSSAVRNISLSGMCLRM